MRARSGGREAQLCEPLQEMEFRKKKVRRLWEVYENTPLSEKSINTEKTFSFPASLLPRLAAVVVANEGHGDCFSQKPLCFDTPPQTLPLLVETEVEEKRQRLIFTRLR